MSDEKEIKNEQVTEDEVVTVEPGEDVKTVEEEIQAETPVIQEEAEAPAEEVVEEKPQAEEEAEVTEEEKVQDEPEKVENAEEEPDKKEEEDKDKGEESEDKTESEGEQGAVDEKEKEEENVEVVDDHAKELEELEKLRAEMEQIKEAEEVRQLTESREKAITNASKEMDDFNEKLAGAMVDTLKQYGIDPETTFEELQKDPAKFQIAKDIVQNAQRIQAEKQAELMKPITEASNAIIFREAGKAMAAFNLNEEQTKIAAETLINIFDATGLANLTDDLKAKVELAVARAKMIAPKVAEVVEDVKEIAEDTKEAVKDVIEAKAEVKEAPKAEVEAEEEKEEEKKQEPEATEEKPSIEAFKEGAVADANVSAPVETITSENVLEILQKLPHKERAAFYKANLDKIDAAMNQKHKELGR